MGNIEKEIKANIEIIVKSLEKGYDVEIRRSKEGVTIAQIRKTVVAR